jgi:predicted nucleic acid-binding protein
VGVAVAATVGLGNREVDRGGQAVKAVVDTNVIAYFLLGTQKFVAEARAFWNQASELIAPSIWEAEIANVIWMAARANVVSKEDATAKLALAGRLGVHSINNRTLWHGALARSMTSGVAVYDTLYVELADREGIPMVTFDEKVLKTYPAIAKRPRDLGE